MSDHGYRHPTALVESEDIGPGTRIWAYAHVMADVHVGANCNIGDHCFVEAGAHVGDNVTIKNGNMIWEGVTLEDGVFVGPHAFFVNDLYPRSPRLPEARGRYTDRTWLVPTLVRRGASLGAGAIILAGNPIGAFAMVGAGAVVTRPVPEHGLVIGNPARLVGWVCQCGLRLGFAEHEATCAGCGRRYHLEGDRVVLVGTP
ncbi:MAG: N-acetyltransferase [Chloroflexi bacterium]|nr:N-acetyltransferase [Chloroflexota bacterium]